MTRTRWLIAALVLLAPAVTRAQGTDGKAVQLAQKILSEGSALFDKKDAQAMAATFTEDAKLFLVNKNQNSGEYEIAIKDGRADIETVYQDLFNDGNQSTTSRNTVTSARMIASDLLLAEGVFEPDVNSPGKYPFVQVRLKQGDSWRVMSMRVFLISAN